MDGKLPTIHPKSKKGSKKNQNIEITQKERKDLITIFNNLRSYKTEVNLLKMKKKQMKRPKSEVRNFELYLISNCAP